MISGSSVSDSALKRGYWYLTHKELLHQILIYILIFINLLLWIFALFFALKIFILDRKPFFVAVNQFGKSRVNYSTFNQANQPLTLRPQRLQPLKTTGGKYDLLMTFKNENNDWVGRVVGKFMVGDIEYDSKSFSVLPGEVVNVIEAGVDPGKGLFSPKFVIETVQWIRVGNKDTFNRFVKEHSDFPLSNIVYKSSSDLQLGNKVAVSGVEFDIANNTLYDFWTLDFNVLFKQGGTIVAADVVSLDEFRVGQNRKVSFRVFDNLSGVTSVEVKPFVDIFDDSKFIEDPLIIGEIK